MRPTLSALRPRPHKPAAGLPPPIAFCVAASFAFTLACSNNDTPAPTSPTAPTPPTTPTVVAPQLTGVSAEPSGVGLQNATNFSLQPTGELGTNSTFSWNLGDGATRDGGASIVYTYDRPGAFTVRAEARNSAGTSSASRTVDVSSLIGTWAGTLTGHANAPAERPAPITSFELTINLAPRAEMGPVLGRWRDSAGCDQSTLVGQVGHPRNVVLSVESLICNGGDLTLTGTLDGTGNVIEGRCPNGGASCAFRMERR